MAAKNGKPRRLLATATKARSLAQSTSPVRDSVLWLILLVATVPAIAREGLLRPGLTLGGAAYLFFSATAILAFVLFGGQRRRTLFLFSCLLVPLQILTGWVGWERLLFLFALVVVLTVLVEAFRQNRALYGELKARDAGMGRLLRRTVYLWSPLLLFVLVGILASRWLSQMSEAFVYDTTLIDRYCDVAYPAGSPASNEGSASSAPGQTRATGSAIPCTRMNGLLDHQTLRELEPLESARIHVATAYSNRKELVLSESLPVPDGRPSGSDDATKGPTTWPVSPTRLRTGPADVLELRGDDDVTLYARDVRVAMARVRANERELRGLENKRKAHRSWKKKHFLKRFFPPYNSLEAEYDAQLGALRQVTGELEEREIEAQEKYEEAFKRLPADEMAVRRARIALADDLDERFAARAGIKNTTTLAFQLFQELSDSEAVANESLFGRKQGIRAVWRDRPEVFLAALGADRLCVLEAKSDLVENGEPEQHDDSSVDLDLFRCPDPLPTEGDALTLTHLDLAESSRLSVARWRAREAREHGRRLSAAVGSGDDLEKSAKELSNLVAARIDLGRAPCKKTNLLIVTLYDPPLNCLGNRVKEETEVAYGRARRKLDDALDEAMETANDSAEQGFVEAAQLAYRNLDAAETLFMSSINRLQQGGRVLKWLVNFLLVLAVIKSVLYVFATEIFDSDEIATVDLGGAGTAQGSYLVESHLRIPRTFTRPMVTKAVLDNQEIDKVLFHRPFNAPLSRIRRGSYFVLNRGSHLRRGTKEMRLSRARGEQVVDWQMREGEEVVFHYRNFFGASDNIELRTTWSLRLSTILLGRIVFHSAYCREGDGHLILTIAGRVDSKPDEIESTTLDRLVAWNKHTRFKISSRRTIKSVFVDGYAIEPVRISGAPSGLILVEAIGAQHAAFTGTIRFIKTLLMPF